MRRLERVTRALSAKADAHLSIEMHSAARQEMSLSFAWVRTPVGEGQFTVQSDRDKIAVLLKNMIQKKLQFYLVERDFHSYRMILNLQRVLLRSLPVTPIESLIPGFDSDSNDPAAFAAANFMYQNGFESIHERDEAGWTPICYAALDGSPMLITTLLEQRADVNDMIMKMEPLSQFAPHTPLLHICSFLTNNDAIKVLLSNRADVNAKDGYGATALLWTAISNNVEGLKLLISAGCDPKQANFLGYCPFIMASAAGSVETMRELLQVSPRQEVDRALHAALLHGDGGTAAVVSTLIHAGADVDHQLSTPLLSPLGVMFAGLSLRHRWKQSILSAYAYHHYKATPLMCSILTSSFEATAVLLAAGAKIDVRNARGSTAADLAMETAAPDYIVSALQEDGVARQNMVMEFADLVPDFRIFAAYV